MAGKLYIVGVGPGHHDHMTFRAKEAIVESDTIDGYETYVRNLCKTEALNKMAKLRNFKVMLLTEDSKLF